MIEKSCSQEIWLLTIAFIKSKMLYGSDEKNLREKLIFLYSIFDLIKAIVNNHISSSFF
jgi:hypothetical protein